MRISCIRENKFVRDGYLTRYSQRGNPVGLLVTRPLAA
jgi:hypothetical protein